MRGEEQRDDEEQYAGCEPAKSRPGAAGPGRALTLALTQKRTDGCRSTFIACGQESESTTKSNSSRHPQYGAGRWERLTVKIAPE
eukprot:765049-Hanusia_phi.AAC.1